MNRVMLEKLDCFGIVFSFHSIKDLTIHIPDHTADNICIGNRSERVAEWLRRLTRKPKVRTAVGSNPTLDSLVAVRNTSPGRPEPCEGNLVAVTGIEISIVSFTTRILMKFQHSK